MFKLNKKIPGKLGRAGVLTTDHGEIQTPAFVAVGTKASIKSLSPKQVVDTGSQVVLANTYHLHLQPGEKVIKKAGGLHEFMNWPRPIMTDSGGFQAFSLGVAYGQGIGKFISTEEPEAEIRERLKKGNIKGKQAKVTEEGVEFKSVIDGSKHFLSPEKSIQIQNDLGADIIFALDEFTSPHAEKQKIKATIERTERWAKRCLIENYKLKIKNSKSRALFGIVQGGRYEDLRKISTKQIASLDFDGFGIGGTFVKEDMATVVAWVNEILPQEKPRHLLGVGEPLDLFLAVENGCDTFDCVAPTRMARNGTLYSRTGKTSITNAKYKNQNSPFDSECSCYFCENYTASYLTHLFRAKEMFAATLATIHNLYFVNSLVKKMRIAILEDKFFELKDEFQNTFKI